MSIPIATATRQQIRQAIGDNIGAMIASSASATGSPTALSDQYALSNGGQDEYLGHQIMVNQSGTVAADYAKRFVTASSAGVLTLNSALAATTVSGNAYELWKPPYTIEQINNLIAQAEREVSTEVFVDKTDETVFTQIGAYRYAVPSGFLGIHTIEYVESESESETIEDCDSAWNEMSGTSVIVSADSTLRDGETWLKIDVAAAATTGLLTTQAITSSLDLRDCTEVEFSVFANSALAASAMQLVLDNTALCASTTEALNFPAIAVNTFGRYSVSLNNPPSDSAIISVGVRMVTDSTVTLWLRNIKAVRADSRNYEKLLPEYWNLVRGSTNYLQLTYEGKSVTGNDCLLRLNGYSAVTAMTTETANSQVDPQWLTDRISSKILLSRKPGSDEARLGAAFAAEAAKRRLQMSTPIYGGTRWL